MKNTIEELENDYWPEPEYGSHLALRCHLLRKKPIEEFSVEDFRVMIGQNIGSEHLIPIALEKIRENPIVSGDLFSGDLLKSLIENEYVNANPAYNWEVAEICLKAIHQAALKEIEEPFFGQSPSAFGLDDKAIEKLLQKAIDDIQLSQPWKNLYCFYEQHRRNRNLLE